MIARAVLVAATLFATTARAQPASIADLERELRTHPDDVDRRLRFATALAWANRRDDARREANAVLVRAPDYLDAWLLLARLDAGEQRWRDARARLEHVLAAQPSSVEARLLAVDLAVWSDDIAAARLALALLDRKAVGDVEYLYREAQIAVAERDHRRAVSIANRIITLDPDHAGARGIGASISTISVESATDAELFPSHHRERVAVGETLTATLFPRARWSATFVYEFRRRFATDNHRVGARADWRPSDRWSVLAFARIGDVEVVPRLTTFAEVRWDKRGWVAGGRYTYDRMPWSADLHRAQITAGAPLRAQLHVEGDVMVGVLRGCAMSTRVWSARARLGWTRGRWALGGDYGYGLEADRVQLGSDPCASVETDVHAATANVTRMLHAKLSLRIGYGTEFRARDTIVHLGTVAVRAWF